LTAATSKGISLSWAKNQLLIHDPRLPGKVIDILYIEAFCRPGSTHRIWEETVIPHTTKVVEASPAGNLIRLESQLSDGVVVEHTIESTEDEVKFFLKMTNRSNLPSQAHWAQPCIRVHSFVGVPMVRDCQDYLGKCFVFLDNKLTRLPTKEWNTNGVYVPGQAWCPTHVNRDDVNPRPTSPFVTSNGLIGCFSQDEKMVLATAWEPYQELFQGIFVCLHSDFRIGGLLPGETKTARGRIYIVDADIKKLLARYEQDFPEHRTPPVNS